MFAAIESVSNMDGIASPRRAIVESESMPGLLCGWVTRILVVNEAYGAGLHRPRSRGMVTVLGLEGRVLVQSYTFNKVFAASGGAYLSSGFLQLSSFIIPVDASSTLPINAAAFFQRFLLTCNVRRGR